MRKISLVLILSVALCAVQESKAISQPILKDTFQDDFIIGAALNGAQIMGEQPGAMDLVEQQFNSITPENILKWGSVHPEPGSYRFEAPDRFVEFGESNDIWINGHTLVWHNQTPDWVFENEDGSLVDRKTLLERMKSHIEAVAGRYKKKIESWDVVNEAVLDDGSMRNSKWRQIIGDDYIAKAFEFTHEVIPEAELYYNDYDLWIPAKRKGVIRMIKSLQKQGVPISGVGMQTHIRLDYPNLDAIKASLKEFNKLGIKIMMTEVDVDVLPRPENPDEINNASGPEWNIYPESLPDSTQQKLADKYNSLFNLFLKYSDDIHRVTFWGVHDGQSWLNYWPIGPRTNYPLLFDREYNTKPAFDAVIKVK